MLRVGSLSITNILYDQDILCNTQNLQEVQDAWNYPRNLFYVPY